MRTNTLLLGLLLLTGWGGMEGDLLAALQAKDQRPLCVGTQILGVDALQTDDGK